MTPTAYQAMPYTDVIEQIYNVFYTCTFKFSTMHIKKCKLKQVKLIVMVHFI